MKAKSQAQSQALTEEQKLMYASEKLDNFRWISKALASYSPRVLTSADMAPASIQLELAEIGQFTELAYCTVPLTFVLENLTALVQDDFPFEGYDTMQDVDLISDFYGDTARLHGFIAYRRPTKQLIISISGTANLKHALYDVWATRRRHPSSKGEVHSGFWSLYSGIRSHIFEGIQKGLQKHDDVTEVVVTGHSMGGALSYFFLLDLFPRNDIVPTQIPIKLVAFGAPRFGNAALRDHWQAVIQEYRNLNGENSFQEYSVKTYNDGVPSLPPLSLGYRHLCSKPLYFVHERLFHIPESEAEFSLFQVEDVPDSTPPPQHPLGGHNYYNGRDQEKFIRRMRWMNEALAKSDKDWQTRYRRFVELHTRKSTRSSWLPGR